MSWQSWVDIRGSDAIELKEFEIRMAKWFAQADRALSQWDPETKQTLGAATLAINEMKATIDDHTGKTTSMREQIEAQVEAADEMGARILRIESDLVGALDVQVEKLQEKLAQLEKDQTQAPQSGGLGGTGDAMGKDISQDEDREIDSGGGERKGKRRFEDQNLCDRKGASDIQKWFGGESTEGPDYGKWRFEAVNFMQM